ncbi:hypothetical protein TYRP_016866, partial [Tyrophagus putrescentiae]
MFIKSSPTTITTTSIAFLALLISLMGVCAFAELEKLPICDSDPLFTVIKNEDRNAVLKLIQYDSNYLLKRTNIYKSLYCDSHSTQTSDCVSNNETLKMILFAFAVLGSACICFCFGAGILYCTFWCVDWLMAKLCGSTPATNSIEMTTHEQEHP